MLSFSLFHILIQPNDDDYDDGDGDGDVDNHSDLQHTDMIDIFPTSNNVEI